MKVLHVTNMWPDSTRPTSGTFVRELVDALNRYRGTHDVFSINRNRGSFENVRSVFRLRKLLEEDTSYDLIHSQYAHSGAVALLASKLPVVSQFHGEFGYGYFQTEGFDLKTTSDLLKTKRDAILASVVSKFAAGVVVVTNSHLEKISTLKKICIPLGVNTAIFNPANKEEASRQVQWPPQTRRILFGSNPVRPDKNYTLFSKCLELVGRKMKNIEEVHLKDMSREEVALTMNASDLLLLTSYTEASPTVVKEACLCNLPVVSVSVGDVKWQLAGLESCRVVLPQADLLAEAVLSILSDGTRSNGWAERSEIFSIEKSAERIYDFYEQVLGNEDENSSNS